MSTTMRPDEAIRRLTAISPCPIIHSTDELPLVDPMYGRRCRSCYFRKRGGRYGRAQDYILVNRGEARAWRYVTTLAHEVGHALDYHGRHPAQAALPPSHSSRYRAELAAVAFAVVAMRQLGLSDMKSGRRWTAESVEYLQGYTRGANPSLESVLRIMPRQVL